MVARGASGPRIRQGPRWEVIPVSLLQDIHASDQAMYPAPKLTLDVLKGWLVGCPDLSICFRYGNEEIQHSRKVLALKSPSLHGSIIVLPLQKTSWERLLRNELKEHDVDLGMFAPLRDGTGVEKIEVGLHVFHIERSQGFREIWSRASFTTMALEEVRRRVSVCFPWWKVIGYSGESKCHIHHVPYSQNTFHTFQAQRRSPQWTLAYN